MSTFQITTSNGLATLTLDRGRSNPINHDMVKELAACIKQLNGDDTVSGLVITGKPGFFSSGIDLIEAYDYDEEQIKQFWVDFLALPGALCSFKKPLIAAINGHSPAGGCVIALCCDYRVMAEGQFIIGLNEIPVGIIVPDGIFKLYSSCIGEKKAYQYIMDGKLLNPTEAHNAGLVDEICSAENLLYVAEKKARTLMQFNPVTWSTSKLNLRADLINKLKQDDKETLTIMLKQWWAPETRNGLQMMIEKLKSK
ncbi:enoyl-CoA hydratase/isomerase family protein [Mucilaginibacter sp.]